MSLKNLSSQPLLATKSSVQNREWLLRTHNTLHCIQYPATVQVPFFECVLVSRKFLACRLLIHAAKTSSVWSSMLFMLIHAAKTSSMIFCQFHALSCCSSVPCTFGTGNNFKLNAASKEHFFPNKCRSSTTSTWTSSSILASFFHCFLWHLLPHGLNYLNGWVWILIKGRYYFRQSFGYYSTCGHYSRKYGTFFWTCGHDLLTL